MDSHFKLRSTSQETIETWISLLSSTNPVERSQAQTHLIGFGRSAVTDLIKLTTHPEPELRREAALVLGYIQDPSAIPALINLLVDEAFEVRWRSAESLVKLKRKGIIPLFLELQQSDRFDSVWFLEGVLHVLRKLDEEGYLGLPSQQVLAAFNDPVREIAIPKAAEKAVRLLKMPA